MASRVVTHKPPQAHVRNTLSIIISTCWLAREEQSIMKHLAAVVVLIFLATGVECKQSTMSPDSSPTTGEQRARLTLSGLMDYYWDHDPVAKNISFFFACGQIGGMGSPNKWSKCSCYNQESCLNCYRWWDAVAIESLATYGMYTNSTNNSDVADSVFDHSPYNGDWPGYHKTFVDYGISYLRVYEWLNVRYFHMHMPCT